jgi:hypothetical protein
MILDTPDDFNAHLAADKINNTYDNNVNLQGYPSSNVDGDYFFKLTAFSQEQHGND